LVKIYYSNIIPGVVTKMSLSPWSDNRHSRLKFSWRTRNSTPSFRNTPGSEPVSTGVFPKPQPNIIRVYNTPACRFANLRSMVRFHSLAPFL